MKTKRQIMQHLDLLKKLQRVRHSESRKAKIDILRWVLKSYKPTKRWEV